MTETQEQELLQSLKSIADSLNYLARYLSEIGPQAFPFSKHFPTPPPPRT